MLPYTAVDTVVRVLWKHFFFSLPSLDVESRLIGIYLHQRLGGESVRRAGAGGRVMVKVSKRQGPWCKFMVMMMMVVVATLPAVASMTTLRRPVNTTINEGVEAS